MSKPSVNEEQVLALTSVLVQRPINQLQVLTRRVPAGFNIGVAPIGGPDLKQGMGRTREDALWGLYQLLVADLRTQHAQAAAHVARLTAILTRIETISSENADPNTGNDVIEAEFEPEEPS